MFLTYFLKFLKIFSDNYRLKLVYLTFISVLCGFLEFLGVALVFPLIVVILQPEQVSQIPIVGNYFKDVSQNASILFGFGIVLAFVIKNLFMIYRSYYQFDLLKDWQIELNLSVYKKYLYSSYENKLNMPSKYSIFQVWNLNNLVFVNFLTMVLNFISNFIILSIVLVFLVVKFKIWALLTGAFFLLTGLLQNNFFKDKGRQLVRQKVEVMNLTSSSFLSTIKNFKDIKIFAKENYFYNTYKKYLEKVGKIECLISFFNTIPQNIVELCIIGAIIIMCYGVVQTTGGEVYSMVASFSLLAAAMFRMAPIINKLQSNLNMINMSKPAIIEFFDAYEFYGEIAVLENNVDERLELKEKIKIKNLSYSYDDVQVLDNLSFEIEKGEFLGVIGKSGVGKSTFLDVLMGLLSSYVGEINVDDVPLTSENISVWMNAIGYVPQEISVLPASIAQNIAFGVAENEIDYLLIDKVIEMTELKDFVSGLQNGVKEDISGLSLGQRQRLGIARALYKNPQILFLDEITASLDVETENNIVNCLNSLKGDKTIIAIAHRISTLKKCDRILYFKSSDTVLSGTFEELINKDEEFANIIKLASVEDVVNNQ